MEFYQNRPFPHTDLEHNIEVTTIPNSLALLPLLYHDQILGNRTHRQPHNTMQVDKQVGMAL